VNCRRLGFVKYVARMGNTRSSSRLLFVKPLEKVHLEECKDRIITLRWIKEKIVNLEVNVTGSGLLAVVRVIVLHLHVLLSEY
jgi:hypothetical protein